MSAAVSFINVCILVKKKNNHKRLLYVSKSPSVSSVLREAHMRAFGKYIHK